MLSSRASLPKLVILDRDGVINEDRIDFVKNPEEVKYIPGSLEAIARLNQAGYTVVIASNQSILSKRKQAKVRAKFNLPPFVFTEVTLAAIHQKIQKDLQAVGGEIKTENIFICPHDEEDQCDCRKPKSGLFFQIAQRFHLSQEERQKVLCVGDGIRDYEAALGAGFTWFIGVTDNGKYTEEEKETFRGYLQAKEVKIKHNLSEAVDDLLNIGCQPAP